tara:strand:+ start:55 stop:954 length:900 start_codon:yes stop_codon:yes gene_type:complete
MAIALAAGTGKSALRQMNHVTNGLIEQYPDDGVASPTSSATANTYGSYVELIAANEVTVPFALIGFKIVHESGAVDLVGAVVNFASGAAASEVNLGEFASASTALHTNVAYHTDSWIQFPNPIAIQANTRISARVMDGVAAAQNARICVVIQRLDNLVVEPRDVMGYTDRAAIVAPSPGTAWPTCTAGSSNAYGSWVQILAATSGDQLITGVACSPDSTWDAVAAMYMKVQIGLVEVAAVTAPFLHELVDNSGHIRTNPVTLPIGVYVPSGVELKARIKANTASDTARIAVQLSPHPIR